MNEQQLTELAQRRPDLYEEFAKLLDERDSLLMRVQELEEQVEVTGEAAYAKGVEDCTEWAGQAATKMQDNVENYYMKCAFRDMAIVLVTGGHKPVTTVGDILSDDEVGGIVGP